MPLGPTALLARPAGDDWQRAVDIGAAACAGRRASCKARADPGAAPSPERLCAPALSRQAHSHCAVGIEQGIGERLRVRSKPIRSPAEALGLML